MKKLLLPFLMLMFLGYSSTVEAQFKKPNIKKTMKKAVKSAAERNYERLTKQLEDTEKALQNGENIDGYLKHCEKFVKWVKKADPNFDTSKEEALIAKLKTTSSGKVSNDESWRKIRSTMNRYYDEGNYVSGDAMFMNDKFLEDAKTINLEEIKSTLASKKSSGSLDNEDKIIETIINDYGNFLNRAGIVDFFMTKLDLAKPRAGSSNPTVTIELAKDIKKRAEALMAFAGDGNKDVLSIIKVADRLIDDSHGDMSSVLTGTFHKEHIGQIVFSSKPLIIGSENASDVKTSFKTGDAIYGTVYFGRTLNDMLKTANFTKNGVTNFDMKIMKPSYGSMLGQAEKWEIDSYAFHDDITVHRNDLKNSYVQFILIPKSHNEVTDYVKAHNYTPVIFMRGLASQSPRNVKISVSFSHVDYSGMVQDFNSEFEIDLSEGEGPDFYLKEQNKLIDKYIEDNELPNAGMNNSSLEQQMITHMNSKGWQETFVDAIIEQGDWTIEYELGKPVRRIINAFMVAKHPDGYCFYHNYGFESRPTASGWGAPQYRSSGARTRILCSKVK